MRPTCRAPCGARGLKLQGFRGSMDRGRRAPCGARGLKSSARSCDSMPCLSRSLRSAWIEISIASGSSELIPVALPAERVD